MIESRIVLRRHEDLAVVADLVLVGVRIRVVGLLDRVVVAAGVVDLTACAIFHHDAIQFPEIWHVTRADGRPDLAVQLAMLHRRARLLILVEVRSLRHDFALVVVDVKLAGHLVEVTGGGLKRLAA